MKASLEKKSMVLDSLQKSLGESRSESQQLVQQKEQQLTQLKLDLEKVSVLAFIGKGHLPIFWC